MSPVVVLVPVVLVIVVGGIVVIAVVSARSRARTLVAAGGAPTRYGEAMSPVPDAFRNLQVDVAGLPAVVSVSKFVPLVFAVPTTMQALAGQAVMQETPGRVHLKVPLGPQWPNVVIMLRAGAQVIGTALARSMGTAGTEITTGDSRFDGQYYVASLVPDPRAALAIVNPQVRAFAITAHLLRWQIKGGAMWIEVGYWNPYDENATIDWVVRLATLAVTTSGYPVIRPGAPSPMPEPGQGFVPAPGPDLRKPQGPPSAPHPPFPG